MLPRDILLHKDKESIWPASANVLLIRDPDGAYLVDVETFELLHRRMAVLEGIALSEVAVAEGRVIPHAEAKARMARWLK